MLVVRPARNGDLSAMMDLAARSGRGFTSLPEDEETLADRLDLAERSFAGDVAPTDAWYTLMLEDVEDGTVAGLAAVRGAVGLARPHFSFRLMTLAQYSAAIDTRFDHQALVLVNECGGWTEVGSLFVRPEYRSGGAGSLLARARYALIGMEPARFAPTVMAELRGWFDEDDRSPFWEGVASKFFRLPFEEADRMVTVSDGQFILDLAPRHPIYVGLIDPEASAAIGRVHRDGERALSMLEGEGFRPCGLIDIFDGGPTVSCPRDSIATICGTRTGRVVLGEPEGEKRLLSAGGISGFRAAQAPVAARGEELVIDAGCAAVLGMREGDVIHAAFS